MHSQLRRLARNTAVPLGLAVVLLVWVLVGLPWYYQTYRGALPERGLSPVELEWTGAYAPWSAGVAATLALAYEHHTSVDGELGVILERLVGCGDALRERAGSPPSERLDPVLERALAACEAAAAARTEYHARDETPSQRSTRLLAAARDALFAADVQLRRLLLAQARVPRRGGRLAESRVDPRLSRSVSEGQPLDVVCWSADEWPQVRAELAAVGQVPDRRLRADVNAYRFRVHASPGICDALVRFAYPAGSPRVELADAAAAAALTKLLRAARHAAGEAADDIDAGCEGGRAVVGAALRLGADRESADLLGRLARQAAGC